MTLARFGRWLESRFPEKLQVRQEDWTKMKEDVYAQGYKIEALNQKLGALETSLGHLSQRLDAVEKVAVHKGAVQDLVAHVKAMTEEIAVLKTGLGLSRPGNAELQALLNGDILGVQEGEKDEVI